MTDQNRFTIIVPTRERAKTLFHTLRTITEQDYDNLVILICDNHSNDETYDVVKSFSDPRIRYIRTEHRLSMSHNWEYALSHVDYGWISFLGDDDGLLPGAITRINNIVNETDVDALHFEWCHYYWPDFEGTSESKMYIPLGNKIQLMDGRSQIAKLMKGEISYHQLPMVYICGFVKKNVIDSSRDRNGQFFLSSSPDVYSAIAISHKLKKYLYVRTPVSIAGTSNYSIGNSSLNLSSNKKPIEKFLSEGNIPYNPIFGDINFLPCLPLIIYDSYLNSEFLHHNIYSVNLIDQLSLALESANVHNLCEVESFVKNVCTYNDIKYESIIEHISLSKTQQKDSSNQSFSNQNLIISWSKSLIMELKKRIVNNKLEPEASWVLPTEYGVRNVYEASILAQAIIQADIKNIY